MDGENNGNPIKMGDLGQSFFLGNPHMIPFDILGDSSRHRNSFCRSKVKSGELPLREGIKVGRLSVFRCGGESECGVFFGKMAISHLED